MGVVGLNVVYFPQLGFLVTVPVSDVGGNRLFGLDQQVKYILAFVKVRLWWVVCNGKHCVL